MKSFECSSPSELDRKFLVENSLLSAVLSPEQLPTSRASNETVAEGSDPKLSTLSSLYLSSEAISPSLSFSYNKEIDNYRLAVPLQGKSSTPHMFLQKQKKPACFDQSYSDLSASQMSWEVSLIRPDSNSPRSCMESSALEQAWSPNTPTTQHPLPEVSP